MKLSTYMIKQVSSRTVCLCMTTDMCHCIQKHSIQMETKAKTTIDKVKLCSPSTLKDLKYSNLISGYQVMAVRVT